MIQLIISYYNFSPHIYLEYKHQDVRHNMSLFKLIKYIIRNIDINVAI